MIRHTIAGSLLVLLFTTTAIADGPPTSVRGSLFTPQTTNNIPSGKTGIYRRASDGRIVQHTAANTIEAIDKIGYFNVVDYGAKGDGTTDDAPAFQAAWDAAKATTGNGRSGIVVIPPAADSYRIASAVVVSILGSGTPANTVGMLGCGCDGALKLDLNSTTDAFSLSAQGEWFHGWLDGLCLLTSDLTNATVDVRDAFVLTAAGPANWDVRNMQMVGPYVYGSVLHLKVGNYRIDNFHDGGTIAYGADYSYIIKVDGSNSVEVNNAYSFWQGQYRGTTIENGTSRALFGIFPMAVADYNGNNNGTKFYARNVWSGPRNLQLFYVVGDSTHVAKTVTVEDFFISSGGNDVVYADHVDAVALRRGTLATSGSNSTYDLGAGIGRFRLEDVSTGTTGGVVHVLADAGVGTIEAIDSTLDSYTGAPCGVKLANATATKAYVTVNGVRARVRQAQAAVVASTLGKAGSTNGMVDQLGTGDDARLVTGVILDGGSTNDFVRVVEQQGQEVQVKQDGAFAIYNGNILTASASSAGRVKVTSTANASTVGDVTTGAAATADALVTFIWGKSQY